MVTVLDIDVVGTFTMCNAALQYLKKGGPGKAPSEAGVILNISAALRYKTAGWYQIHLSAAKVYMQKFLMLRSPLFIFTNSRNVFFGINIRVNLIQ